MKLDKKRRFGVAIVVVSFLLVALPFVIEDCIAKHKSNLDKKDADALRNITSEAYVNIMSDPEFVNTATVDQLMEVPEKYYTYVESVQGHGPVYVFVDINYNVDAYFGTPEKDIRYYSDFTGTNKK